VHVKLVIRGKSGDWFDGVFDIRLQYFLIRRYLIIRYYVYSYMILKIR